MKNRVRRALQATLIAIAIFFIVCGVLNKEPQIVLMKATKICLECIGIG